MQRSDVRPSVPSVDSRCGLLLWAGDIDQEWRAPGAQQQRHSAANAGSVMLTAELVRLN